MSHTTSVKAIKIQNVSALHKAIAELAQGGMRISLVPNAKPRAYFENQQGMGMADFVIQIPDAKYDIGLYKTDKGEYEARTDFYGGTVERVLGGKAMKPENAEQAKMGKLFQTYGIWAATEEAQKKGYMVQRRNGQDGTVKLEITGNF